MRHLHNDIARMGRIGSLERLMGVFATYRLEHRYLSSFKIMVGFNIFSVVAVEICKLRRHSLKTLVVVFARRRRKGWLVGGVIVRSGWCLDRRHDMLRRVHGKTKS